MVHRGQIYLVTVQRRDGRSISYRTCDEAEARRVAVRLGTAAVIEGSDVVVEGI